MVRAMSEVAGEILSRNDFLFLKPMSLYWRSLAMQARGLFGRAAYLLASVSARLNTMSECIKEGTWAPP